MAESGKWPSLEQIVEDYYNPKYRLSDIEFYIAVLPAADGEDPDSFIERIPEHLRAGLEEVVFDYLLSGEGESVSFGFREPKEETVRGLRRAFERRRFA
jgi:hypothetical protein